MPFVQDIADYGSLKKVIEADPLNAAISFLDTVILSTTINILSLFPFFQGNTDAHSGQTVLGEHGQERKRERAKGDKGYDDSDHGGR